MKKTLFTLLALSGMAMAADTIDVAIMELPTTIGQITDKPDNWNQNIGNQKSITAAIVATDLNVCSTLASDGWHWGVANLQNVQGGDCTVSGSDISFHGRQGYGGEFVACTLDVATLLDSNSALLNSNSVKALTGLTFNFSRGSSSQSDVTFSVWHWDGTSTAATALIAANDALSTSATDYTWTATGDGYTSGKVLLVFSEYSGGALNTIEGFNAKATLVPEPATATLSLLALAGLAARRKRH